MSNEKIKDTAGSFKYWDDEVQRLEKELVQAKKSRSDFRERLLEQVTRYDLDEL